MAFVADMEGLKRLRSENAELAPARWPIVARHRPTMDCARRTGNLARPRATEAGCVLTDPGPAVHGRPS